MSMDNIIDATPAITAHDLYAAAALNALITDKDIARTGGQAIRTNPHGFIAKICHMVADAMVAEREKRHSQDVARDR